MADKEATVYIVDVGATMGACHSGRSQTDLDWVLEYVWDKLCSTVAASRKTWTVGVLGLRTDKTFNEQQAEEGYENIEVLQQVGPMSLSSLRALKKQLHPNETTNGDAVSAIIVATDMISRAAPKRLKYNRRIVLVTDGLGPIDGDDFDDVATQINELGIQLMVVGVDFDDADFGYKEEQKPKLKARNEKLLRALVDKCADGVFGTFAEAHAELQRPNVKSTRPYKTYDGALTLGDPATYQSALSIHVERYFQTKVARPPTATTIVVHEGTAADTDMQDIELAHGDFALQRSARVYTVEDPTVGKMEVDFETLEKGYEYGRTAVYISESDRNITQLETTKSFSIVGFVTRHSAEPYLSMGESCVIVPLRFSERDEMAFSTLVNAMQDTKACAVARYVAKDMKEPQMLLLIPAVADDQPRLYDVPLPFAEDVRNYPFPPLDKVITATGTVLTKHRLLPNEDLLQAMDDYVEAMDLSTFGKDDDGQPAEYADLSENYSPIIYRVTKALAFRAVHPDEPYVQQDNEFVLRFDHPPEDLVKQAQPQVDALVKAADVKKVPPKAKGRAGRNANGANKPLSGLDVDALLGSGGGSSAGVGAGAGAGAGSGGSSNQDPPSGGSAAVAVKEEPVDEPAPRRILSANNAIPEFKQALVSATDDAQIADLAQQMGQIIESLIETSLGDLNYDRAAENLRVMREELTSLEEPELYNTFLKQLKTKLAAETLGGPRPEMWWTLRMSGLGLITSNEADASTVTADEAKEFLRYLKPPSG